MEEQAARQFAEMEAKLIADQLANERALRLKEEELTALALSGTGDH